MLGLSVERLSKDLYSASTNPAETSLPPSAFTECFADAWAIVDDLWRLYLLLLRTPGIQRTPDVEVRLRELKIVEEFRDGFQHLDERVGICVRDQLPLWGTLSWAYFPNGSQTVGKVFLLISGSLRPGNFPLVNPAGQPIKTEIDLVTLTAFSHELQLWSLVRRVDELIVGLDRGLRRATIGQPAGRSDMFFSFDYVPGVPDASQE